MPGLLPPRLSHELRRHPLRRPRPQAPWDVAVRWQRPVGAGARGRMWEPLAGVPFTPSQVLTGARSGRHCLTTPFHRSVFMTLGPHDCPLPPGHGDLSGGLTLHLHRTSPASVAPWLSPCPPHLTAASPDGKCVTATAMLAVPHFLRVRPGSLALSMDGREADLAGYLVAQRVARASAAGDDPAAPPPVD